MNERSERTSTSAGLTIRLATRSDLVALQPLIDAAIDELQRHVLDVAQVRASHAIMGIDTQLVDDGTYFVVEADGTPAGCGGWSRRATLYGGDHAAGRDAARVRAMYTHPAFVRRGVGRLVLARCEAAAAREGFTRLELMATRAGQPLYAAAGFTAIEPFTEPVDGVDIPLLRMGKTIAAARSADE